MQGYVIVIIIIVIIILLALSALAYYYFYGATSPIGTTSGIISSLFSPVDLSEPPPQAPDPTGSSQANIRCPQCPDCNCPECPDCNCPVNDQKLKSSETENQYLKVMVQFLGAVARRENAINRAVMKECPTTFSMVPMIQSVDQEFQFIKNDIGVNHDMLQYFNTNFTKLTGIPSASYQEIL